MSEPAIYGVYLAAGKSRRMGSNKLTMPLGNTTVGSKALFTALHSRLKHIFVVTGAEDPLEWIDVEFFSPDIKKRWSQVECSNSSKGQAYSLRCGIAAAENRSASAAMVLLADQPLISRTVIHGLIDNMNQNEQLRFAASSYQGLRRPPVLLDRILFPLVSKLEGDQGAGKLLDSISDKGKTIEYNNWREFYDIDSKEDYQWILEATM
ncbi:NTP transferase domain-containing protein [Alteribacillus sp. HJP-4]|uniref:nucleotidyltransferase family protein n=1 Tax=Alteribacillus sp. HJP-4 TaxID=2775394 RepID=UPI0035CCFF83